MSVTLVLGGTRSGKSAIAERLAAEAAGDAGAVTYVATGTVTDEAMEDRIAAHRRRRPAGWSTLEAGPGTDLAAVLSLLPGVVLLDSIGTWVAGATDLAVDAAGLAAAMAGRPGDTVVVGEEVGMSVHPPTEVGRRFVDAVGDANRAIAGVAGRVLLVVAGRVLELPPG